MVEEREFEPDEQEQSYERPPLDAPEADALEQEREWSGGVGSEKRKVPLDAPEADVLEQSRDAGFEDDDHDY